MPTAPAAVYDAAEATLRQQNPAEPMGRCSQRAHLENTAERLRERYGFSVEELAIARLLLRGRSNAHIAQALEMDGEEVADVVGRIIEKLTGRGCEQDPDAAAAARIRG